MKADSLFDSSLMEAILSGIGEVDLSKETEFISTMNDDTVKVMRVRLPQCQKARCGLIWQVKTPLWQIQNNEITRIGDTDE